MTTSQTYTTDLAGGATGTSATDTAKEQASQVGQSAGQAAAQVADTTMQQARDVAAEATAQARDLAGELRSQLDSQAGTQRDRIVGTLHSICDELERMGRGEGGTDGIAADLVRQAAERARAVAGYLDGREPSDLVAELRSYASRRPTAFLVGAAVAGLVAGRLTRGARDARQSAPIAPIAPVAPVAPVTPVTPLAPYGGTGAAPLGAPLAGRHAADDVLDLDAPATGLGRTTRGDLPGGGAL